MRCGTGRLTTLEGLVRCPSVLGHEQSALEEMARLYAGLGLEPRRVPTVPDQLAGASRLLPAADRL